MPKRGQVPSGGDHGLRIALVDDDEETRLEARRMVRTERDDWALEVYHPSCPNALEGDHGPGGPAEIVLVGVPHREGSRLACVRRIKALAPDLPVLIISSDAAHASIVECCTAGAAGYVLKPFAPGELARAISSVARGWPVLCREAQKAVMNALHQAVTATTVWFPGLSGREQEIAGCLVGNLCDKEINERLGMARSTVHVHLTRLYRKLGVHSRKQAVARLLRVGGKV
jgi:two-component system NarL family response regulator